MFSCWWHLPDQSAITWIIRVKELKSWMIILIWKQKKIMLWSAAATTTHKNRLWHVTFWFLHDRINPVFCWENCMFPSTEDSGVKCGRLPAWGKRASSLADLRVGSACWNFAEGEGSNLISLDCGSHYVCLVEQVWFTVAIISQVKKENLERWNEFLLLCPLC